MVNRFKAARKVSGLRQIDLSEASGVSLATIRRAEAGANVSVPVMIRLAKALNTTVSSLLGEETPDKSTTSRSTEDRR